MKSALADAREAQPVHDALVETLRTIMRPWVSLPRWKFLQEAVSGIVRRRTLVQRHIALALGETGKAPGSVEKRLSAHINTPALAGSVNQGLLQHAASRIEVYTPIAIDLTDTQRPHAFKTPGVEGNFDGSTGKPGRGYTHLCAAAVFPVGDGVEHLPLYQDTYGLEHTTAQQKEDPLLIDSSFAHYERAVRSLSEAFGGPVGIDVMDRGMDSQRCFGCELHHRRWFLVRLCARRRKLSIPGCSVPVYPAEAQAHMQWQAVKCRTFNKQSRKWWRRKCKIAWCTATVTVQYPDNTTAQQQFTFIAVRRGSRVMFLLTNLTIDDAESPLVFAKMLYEAYLARWSVETCFDLLKNRINVETIFARSMCAAQSLFALAWLALACVMETFPRGAPLTKVVVSFFARFHRLAPVCHVFYTVFTALTRIWALMPVTCSLH